MEIFPATNHESRITFLENYASQLNRRMQRREQLLLNRIMRLRRELQDQTSKFETKLAHLTNSASECDDFDYDKDGRLSTVFEEVNGLEFSPSTHRRDVVESLLYSADPVTMEVRYRKNLTDMVDRCSNGDFFDGNVQYQQRISSVSYSTSATQTDALLFNEEDVIEEEDGIGDDENPCPRIAERNPLLSFDQKLTSRGILFSHLANRTSEMDELSLAAEGFIDDTDFDEDCHHELYDVEYEEVTLKRSDGCERLGLTLCYGKGDDVDTDIFVSEIEQNSIAFNDGRIRIGDQILQINGVDVHTRNQAMEQFRRDRNDITLLLARSTMKAGEYLQDTMNDTVVDEERSCSVVREQSPEEEDGNFTDGTKGSAGSAQEKDSGISRATDSDPELPPPINSPSKYSQRSSNSGSGTATTTGTGKDASTPEYLLDFTSQLARHGAVTQRVGVADAKEIDSEQSSAATPTQANQLPLFRQDCNNVNSNKGSINWRRESDDASLERELHFLREEMEHIQLECDRLIEQHTRSENQVRAQMEQANRLTNVLNSQRQQQTDITADIASMSPSSRGQSINDGLQRQFQNPHAMFPSNGRCMIKEETSSAYNTGNESCRSTPLKTIGLISDSLPLTVHNSSVRMDGKRDSAMFTLPPTISRDLANSRDPVEIPMVSQSTTHCAQKRNVATAVPTPAHLAGMGFSTPYVHSGPYAGEIMYTNSENLQNTILLQQRLLRKAMIQQAQQLRAHNQLQPSTFVGSAGPLFCIQEQQSTANLTDNERMRWLMQQQQQKGSNQRNSEGEIVKLEWKIKRRSDGSRYVLRRPVRNKILKERAEKLSSERCGASTDDDAFSELKVGRYWTREERKKHLERAKERKRRQEELLRRKEESLRQTTEQPILQLSNKKMLRRQGQQLFDKFTTVQEFLAHGSRTVDGAGRPLGILSVTTV